MASRSETELIRTTDLVLATYLIIEGFTPELRRSRDEVKPGHPKGEWEFVRSDTLDDCMDSFDLRDARVEPNRFHSQLNETRKGMFQFLGIHKPK